MIAGTEESPIYRKVKEGKGNATKTFMIVCHEGWRESIVCTGMYEWAADWLVTQIQGRPYGRYRDSCPKKEAL